MAQDIEPQYKLQWVDGKSWTFTRTVRFIEIRREDDDMAIWLRLSHENWEEVVKAMKGE